MLHTARLCLSAVVLRFICCAVQSVSSFSSPLCMRVVVVTGADGGIGGAFCRHYASKGDRVFACR